MPPKIRHVGYLPSDSLPEIAADAAAALHMAKGERALLLYYARCTSGFRPALQAIANATGQDRAQVWRNRNALVAHGIASISSASVTIDWKRAKIYASLDPRLTSRHCFTAPTPLPKPDTWRLPVSFLLYRDFDWLLPKLAAMSAADYASLKERTRRYLDEHRDDPAA